MQIVASAPGQWLKAPWCPPHLSFAETSKWLRTFCVACWVSHMPLSRVRYRCSSQGAFWILFFVFCSVLFVAEWVYTLFLCLRLPPGSTWLVNGKVGVRPVMKSGTLSLKKFLPRRVYTSYNKHLSGDFCRVKPVLLHKKKMTTFDMSG